MWDFLEFGNLRRSSAIQARLVSSEQSERETSAGKARRAIQNPPERSEAERHQSIFGANVDHNRVEQDFSPASPPIETSASAAEVLLCTEGIMKKSSI